MRASFLDTLIAGRTPPDQRFARRGAVYAGRVATGVLLVGGASRRFGSPKALARLRGETLAQRAWRILGECFDKRLAVGKRADGLRLPFPVLDDGVSVRHPAAGIVAALRHASNDVCVVLPVDCPAVRAATLRALAEACADAATPSSEDPLPAAYRWTTLPALERCLAERAALADALAGLDVRTVEIDRWELANVNGPADLEALERRESALEAALQTAARHGLEAPAARVLQDWNDTVVHLAPHPVVARVGTSWIAWDKETAFARELTVAAHAAARGGPCVRPSPQLPPGPHRANGLVLAFWELLEREPGPIAPREIATSLRALHGALVDYDGPLPPLHVRHDRAEAVLAAGIPRLGSADAQLLQRAFGEFRRGAARPGNQRVLHGGPHSSNLLRTSDGLRWIDLDTVCRGPLEWDLAHLPHEAAAAFPEADEDLLETMRGLVSAEVAVWCWKSYGRAPEVDEAAHYHLGRIRRLVV